MTKNTKSKTFGSKCKRKPKADKFHLGIQTKYRTLWTPSGKEYNRQKENKITKDEINRVDK